MNGVAVPFIVFGSLFVALPWLVLHYVTKWKQAPKITHEDEQLLDELHLLARRLEDRLNTVERIVAADNPDFKPGLQSEWRPEPRLGQTDYSLDRRN
ncbi:envelope stress response membrane protein PspB [Sphingomonas sanguinis]|jgi:phage shock protein B|uniref:Envelope stress response membrane protein PspB n=1 Tax=Sphingomonas sanguinis TaxID=33051 RepID=A0A147I0U9_9SPHN|nr:envelope stress response membrane protein PspB [Sphingomonas sanguinis]KTT71036.1 phage-shock protein [Sphingomonas sanguinis]MBZ6380156.1 envelope stress response membrane protein PspB [Sphingomonas sanguinis]NNG48785.1 envelope stress response membrane protein PspB [Sphingomonas sanguinis]NNG52032.1 envelope stress response membrane protein PspB [Sphingomonas sanguinis]NVP29457.1 envelope stress response membrane protein PspB [Sphingomonas sanguinis]